MVKVNTFKSAVSRAKPHWRKMLKRIKLDDLKQVCTFSSGGFAHVSLVQLKGHPNATFALKAIHKPEMTNQVIHKNMQSERRILAQVQSDFVVKLYKNFEDKKYLYLLTEFLPGGELLDLAPVSEGAAKFYIACVVEALASLHAQNIVHNDVKPENLVLDADGYAKLIDFGAAKRLRRGELSYDYGGTFAYLPPEVAWPLAEKNEEHMGRDRAADLWALGIVMYDLLGGKRPFDTSGGDKATCRNITKGIRSVAFAKEYFSEEAEDLIKRLCADDPDTRLGYKKIDEIRQHRWFENFDWSKLQNRSLEPPMQPKVDGAADTQNFCDEVKLDLDGEWKTSPMGAWTHTTFVGSSIIISNK